MAQGAFHVEEIELDPAAGDASEQLYARFDPRRFRIDVRQAPLLRLYLPTTGEDRWLMLQLLHHLAGDHTTLEVMQAEVQAYLLGSKLPAGRFPSATWWRRRGWEQAGGARSLFRQMLEDVDEPTAPFGLLDARATEGASKKPGWPWTAILPGVCAPARAGWGEPGQSLPSGLGRVLSKSPGGGCGFRHRAVRRMQGGEGADRVMGCSSTPCRCASGGGERVSRLCGIPIPCWPICCVMSMLRWPWPSAAARCPRRLRCSPRC